MKHNMQLYAEQFREIQQHEMELVSLFEEQQRQCELKELYQDMADMSDIMSSFSSIIHEQGEELDHIENNISRTDEDTTVATEDLEKTYEESKKTRGFITTGVIASGAAILGGVVLLPFTLGGGAVFSILGLGGLVTCGALSKGT